MTVMRMRLEQMVYDLRREVDELRETLESRLPHPARWPEPPAAVGAQHAAPEQPRIANPAKDLHSRVLQAVAVVFCVHEDALRAPKGAAPTMPARRAVATILCNNGLSTVQAGKILGMHQSNICKLRREALATYQEDADFRAHFDAAATLAQELAQ